MNHKPPYYAVIFTTKQTAVTAGYTETTDHMEALAKEHAGYLGMDHARSEIGITISYWETLEDIARWKAQRDHLKAQQKGIKEWYEHYTVKICKVERVYSFDKE
ncbi:MAG: heme-degrading monooxygenase HmoA [Flavobacteriales bacterium]